MIHPVPKKYRIVTQRYGVRNTVYRLTGHHTGTDYATPIGTPLFAPEDGTVTYSADTKGQRGKMVQFKHSDYLLELRHLSILKPKGSYKQGDIIGHSGNSGTLTTGPHTCVVVWSREDGLNKINKENWNVLTMDADKLYI